MAGSSFLGTVLEVGAIGWEGKGVSNATNGNLLGGAAGFSIAADLERAAGNDGAAQRDEQISALLCACQGILWLCQGLAWLLTPTPIQDLPEEIHHHPAHHHRAPVVVAAPVPQHQHCDAHCGRPPHPIAPPVEENPEVIFQNIKNIYGAPNRILKQEADNAIDEFQEEITRLKNRGEITTKQALTIAHATRDLATEIKVGGVDNIDAQTNAIDKFERTISPFPLKSVIVAALLGALVGVVFAFLIIPAPLLIPPTTLAATLAASGASLALPSAILASFFARQRFRQSNEVKNKLQECYQNYRMGPAG